VRGSAEWWILAENWNVLKQLSHKMLSSTANSPDQIMDRVIGLVKKFDKIDVSKVINGCHYNSLQTLIINLSTLNLF
jgi:NADH dehydrogenase (ubiquinone) 1 alpha/beta subcomplex 1